MKKCEPAVQLIDVALAHSGRLLPYRLHATQEQFERLSQAQSFFNAVKVGPRYCFPEWLLPRLRETNDAG